MLDGALAAAIFPERSGCALQGFLLGAALPSEEEERFVSRDLLEARLQFSAHSFAEGGDNPRRAAVKIEGFVERQRVFTRLELPSQARKVLGLPLYSVVFLWGFCLTL